MVVILVNDTVAGYWRCVTPHPWRVIVIHYNHGMDTLYLVRRNLARETHTATYDVTIRCLSMLGMWL